MAVGTNVISGGQYAARGAEERARAFISARRHTRLVKTLRKGLPVVAVLVLAAYFINAQMSLRVRVGDLTASIEGMQLTNGNLRMTNPKFEGADQKNGNYVIAADYADQDVKNPKIIRLHAIRAELSSEDGSWSRMRAVRGVFDSKSERLVMQEKITVATSSGINGELKHASLETKTQTLRSHRPVFFTLPNGTVSAGALTYRSADNTLTFRGKVRVHVVKTDGKKEAESKKAPPVPPLPGESAANDPSVPPPESQ